jgi:hypothetical protein
MGHFPHVLLGMIEFDNLYSTRTVLSTQLPDPRSPNS